MQFSLLPYQKVYKDKVLSLLRKTNLVLMHFDTRVGKTPISLAVAKEYGAKNPLVVTKKKAIDGFRKFDSEISIINYESLHKVKDKHDFFIIDESHSVSAFPKPSLSARRLKQIIHNAPTLLLTATPMHESPSQIFHQFWISDSNPFKYSNFYKFAHDYVAVNYLWVQGRQIKEYKKIRTDTNFQDIVDKYTVRLTQAEANVFKGIEEEIITIPLPERIQKVLEIIKKKRVYIFKDGIKLVADSTMKYMQIVHQLSSGIIKLSDSEYRILDTFKVDYIKNNYKKFAIFYLYKGEEKMLRETLNCTDDIQKAIDNENLTFIGQFRSSSMGTDLSHFDKIIMLNIPFSATIYDQVINRGQKINKGGNSKIVWIFSDKGLEHSVYKQVHNKIDYTTNLFKRDFGG